MAKKTVSETNSWQINGLNYKWINIHRVFIEHKQRPRKWNRHRKRKWIVYGSMYYLEFFLCHLMNDNRYKSRWQKNAKKKRIWLAFGWSHSIEFAFSILILFVAPFVYLLIHSLILCPPIIVSLDGMLCEPNDSKLKSQSLNKWNEIEIKINFFLVLHTTF